MIAKLTGLLDSVGDGWLVIDVNGVGYLVQASSRTLRIVCSHQFSWHVTGGCPTACHGRHHQAVFQLQVF